MIRVRTHGSSGPVVIVLHGGPAAAGTAAPIARGLAGTFRALEPLQRGSGEEPLSVACHVADLREVVDSLAHGRRPALVGESWGAMLALAYAAAHPDATGPIVLTGCGTFDRASRARMKEIEAERITDEMRRRIARIEVDVSDPVERFLRKHEILRPTYVLDPIDMRKEIDEPILFDKQAHRETWDDMMRLQDEGVYPAAFRSIRSPVLMLHGAYDPHPGSMIRDSLRPHIPQLEYREWERCGHHPWRERLVREEYFIFLKEWLRLKLG